MMRIERNTVGPVPLCAGRPFSGQIAEAFLPVRHGAQLRGALRALCADHLFVLDDFRRSGLHSCNGRRAFHLLDRVRCNGFSGSLRDGRGRPLVASSWRSFRLGRLCRGSRLWRARMHWCSTAEEVRRARGDSGAATVDASLSTSSGAVSTRNSGCTGGIGTAGTSGGTAVLAARLARGFFGGPGTPGEAASTGFLRGGMAKTVASASR